MLVQTGWMMCTLMLSLSLSVQLNEFMAYLGEATFLLADTVTVTVFRFSKPFNAFTTTSQALSFVSPPLNVQNFTLRLGRVSIAW